MFTQVAVGLGASGTVSCSIGTVGVGSALFTLVVPGPRRPGRPRDAGGEHRNRELRHLRSGCRDQLGDRDHNGGRDATSSITKTGPATVLAGGSIAYTATIANAGTSSASDVTIADPTPASLTS